jgi:hypothetical protein
MKSRFSVVAVLVLAVIAFGALPVGLFAGQASCSSVTKTHIRHVHKKNGSIHHHQRLHQRHQHKNSNQ